MPEEDVERLDWGDDEQQAPPDSNYDYSPGLSQSGYTGAAEDPEDAVSLGGDDDDEREYYANHHHSEEQASVAVPSPFSTSVSHAGKRDSQRQSATTPSRTPSRAKNSESPSRESRPPNSQGKLPPAPLIHGLPPKPTIVAPPPSFEPAAENGIRASAMTNSRRRGVNGGGKAAAAPDGSDPLPPDWEIRYPRNGGKDVYYYNSKTDESTWTRPRLPNHGRSSPTKSGGAQSSGRRSPDIQDN
ncbi:hypothetical protein BD309DRAFT_873966, partial [Dichomitus squalens]